MALPPPFDTPCKIGSDAYKGQFADLSGSTTKDPGIIGFRDMGRGALNQQWTFRPLSYGSMTIETNAKEGTAYADVSGNDPSPDNRVLGVLKDNNGYVRPWWLQSVGPPGLFRIYCFGCNGIARFWTLGSGTNTELIRLDSLQTKGQNQIWAITAIS